MLPEEMLKPPPSSLPGPGLFFTTMEGAPKIKKTVNGVAVDEANLATTMQGLVLFNSFPGAKHWVYVGDERQLKPLVLGNSLLCTGGFSTSFGFCWAVRGFDV